MFSYARNWWGLFYKRQYVCLAMNVTDEGYSTNAPYTSNEMPFDYNHERIGAIRQ
jgi:hypothetical protein